MYGNWENETNIAGKIKDYLNSCSNVIEISIDSNEEEQIIIIFQQLKVIIFLMKMKCYFNIYKQYI